MLDWVSVCALYSLYSIFCWGSRVFCQRLKGYFQQNLKLELCADCHFFYRPQNAFHTKTSSSEKRYLVVHWKSIIIPHSIVIAFRGLVLMTNPPDLLKDLNINHKSLSWDVPFIRVFCLNNAGKQSIVVAISANGYNKLVIMNHNDLEQKTFLKCFRWNGMVNSSVYRKRSPSDVVLYHSFNHPTNRKWPCVKSSTLLPFKHCLNKILRGLNPRSTDGWTANQPMGTPSLH